MPFKHLNSVEKTNGDAYLCHMILEVPHPQQIAHPFLIYILGNGCLNAHNITVSNDFDHEV